MRIQDQQYWNIHKKPAKIYPDVEKLLTIRVATQIVLKPKTQYYVMIKENAYRRKLLDCWTMFTILESTIIAAETIDVCWNWPIYVPVSIFSNHKVPIPQHVKIAQTAELPTIIHAIKTYEWQASSKENPEKTIDFNFIDPDGTVLEQTSQQAD